MAAEAFIQCRVAPATKVALRAAAARQQLTESALLKRTLELLQNTTGDCQLLQARATARCLAPATYASNLLGTHLRSLAPMPEAELRAIRQSTRELAAIGRNLNQIAGANHQGVPGVGVSRNELSGLFKVCVALRDHVRSYINTNVSSWESGDATSKF